MYRLAFLEGVVVECWRLWRFYPSRFSGGRTRRVLVEVGARGRSSTRRGRRGCRGGRSRASSRALEGVVEGARVLVEVVEEGARGRRSSTRRGCRGGRSRRALEYSSRSSRASSRASYWGARRRRRGCGGGGRRRCPRRRRGRSSRASVERSSSAGSTIEEGALERSRSPPAPLSSSAGGGPLVLIVDYGRDGGRSSAILEDGALMGRPRRCRLRRRAIKQEQQQ